ncbi:MAG TPA: hypothetical protein VKP65_12620 [Rhodothermales bacterium]|nr:hypothetical protein [Rhodothermales bacterium]
MLYATSRHKLSWDFTVYQDDVPVAEIDSAWLRERAVLTVGEDRYQASRVAGTFELARDGQVLVRAEEAGLDPSSFTLVYEETVYRLCAKAGDEQVYLLAKKGGSVIGTFQLDGTLTRKVEAHLSSALPLVVRVFVLWLITLAWKRASRAS